MCVKQKTIIENITFMATSHITSLFRKIVIDEAHVYKGAFGCHTALVLRRLRRICSHGM